MTTREEVFEAIDSEGLGYAIIEGYADNCDDSEIAALVEAAKVPLRKLQAIFERDFVYR